MPVQIATDEELSHIENMLANFEEQNILAMQYIKKSQKLSDEDLTSRFDKIKPSLVLRYLQPHYPSTRPIHFMAAFSWVTKIPATSWYLGTKIREEWRGMDDAAVDALICCGSMVFEQFDILINHICFYLNDEAKQNIDRLKRQLLNEIGEINNTVEAAYSAPDIIDLEKFSESYYYSISLALKVFKEENNISSHEMEKILGLSRYAYKSLEDPSKTWPFSLVVGARLRLGFKLDSHVDFTKGMTHYSEFHIFRKLQNYRELVLVESLKHVPEESKKYVINIIKGVAAAYNEE